MASLRSLLNIEGPEEYEDAAGPITGSKEFFSSYCPTFECIGGNGNCCLNFRVPSGAQSAIFEVWGGGGAGAESCCCMQGVPGSSGAYARKQLEVNPGDRYCIRVGLATTCSNGTTGCRGCYSCICGVDLNETDYAVELCAEGGYGGCSRCFCCGFFCTGNVGAAYGGDLNIPSVRSCYWMRCYSNTCYNKILHAYPGGLVNRCGGIVMFREVDRSTSNTIAACQAANTLTSFGYPGQGGYVPGLPGGTASVCGGACCCGAPGHAGLVVVTYR